MGSTFEFQISSQLREPKLMPWAPSDAENHTHKATTQVLKELWAKVANETLERNGDEFARQAGDN
jgi:hypothetical protein